MSDTEDIDITAALALCEAAPSEIEMGPLSYYSDKEVVTDASSTFYEAARTGWPAALHALQLARAEVERLREEAKRAERAPLSAIAANAEAQRLIAERDAARAELVVNVERQHRADVEYTRRWDTLVADNAELGAARAALSARVLELEGEVGREAVVVEQLHGERVRTETANAIARYLVSPECAAECSVDLTDPNCPRGTALTRAAAAIIDTAWRTAATGGGE